MTAAVNNTPFTQEPVPEHTKPYWTKILLLFVVLSLTIAWLFRVLTPEQVPPQAIVQSNYDDSTTTFNKVTYSGEPIVVPDTFPTGRGTQMIINSSDVAKRVSEKLGLEKTESANPRITENFENSEYLLYFSSDENVFNLIRKPDLPSSNLTSTATALKIAQELVDTIYGVGVLTPVQSDIEFLGAEEGSHYDKVSITDAVVMKVPFGPQVGIYPVYLGQTLYHPITVWVNGKNTIQKANINLEYPTITTTTSLKSIPYTQALKNIEEGNASIITTRYDQAGYPSLQTITTGTIRSGKIEYRVDAETETVVPYYQFTGSLTNNQNQTFEATIITPAIQTKFPSTN